MQKELYIDLKLVMTNKYKLMAGRKTIKKFKNDETVHFDGNIKIFICTDGFLLKGKHGRLVYFDEEAMMVKENDYEQDEILFFKENIRRKRRL